MPPRTALVPRDDAALRARRDAADARRTYNVVERQRAIKEAKEARQGMLDNKKIIEPTLSDEYKGYLQKFTDLAKNLYRIRNTKKFDGSKKDLSRDGDARLVARGDDDEAKIKLHNQIASLYNRSMSERLDQLSLLRQQDFLNAFLEIQQAAPNYALAKQHLDAAERALDTLAGTNERLSAHGSIDIDARTLTLHDADHQAAAGAVAGAGAWGGRAAQTIKLLDIVGIRRVGNDTYIDTQNLAAGGAAATYHINDTWAQDYAPTQHRINFANDKIMFSNGVDVKVSEMDFPFVTTVAGVEIKAAAAFSTSFGGNNAFANSFGSNTERDVRDSFIAAQKQSIAHLRDALVTSNDEYIELAFQSKMQEQTHTALIHGAATDLMHDTPREDFEVYAMVRNMKDLGSGKIASVLETRRRPLNDAINHVTKMMKDLATDALKRRGIVPKQTAEQVMGDVSNVLNAVPAGGNVFNANNVHLTTISNELDNANPNWVNVRTAIDNLQVVNDIQPYLAAAPGAGGVFATDSQQGKMVQGLTDASNQMVLHLKRAASLADARGNMNEIRAAFHETAAFSKVIQHNTLVLQDVLDTTNPGGAGLPAVDIRGNAKRMQDLNLMIDNSGDYLLKEPAKETPQQSDERLIKMIDTARKEKDPAKRTALILTSVSQIAREEVEKQVQQAHEEGDMIRAYYLDDKRVDLEKKYAEDYVKQYNEEVKRQQQLDMLADARKLMNDQAKNLIWTNLAANTLDAGKLTKNYDDMMRRTWYRIISALIKF